MKNKIKVSIFCILVSCLIGCREANNKTVEPNVPSEAPLETIAFEDERVLVVYFSRSNNIPVTEGMDTTTSASTLLRNDKMVGNTGYVGEVIQEQTGGSLYTIQMTDLYPSEYDPLNDIAKEEGNIDFRPTLVEDFPDVSEYDVVFLGFPNWWYDMPMAVYAYLEKNDFSNKTVIPFVTHGGSGFSNTIDTLRTILPDATVLEGLSIFQHDVPNSEDSISSWLKEITK